MWSIIVEKVSGVRVGLVMMGKNPLLDKKLIYSCAAAVVPFELDMSIIISPSIYVHLMVRRGLQKASSSFLMNSGILAFGWR